jgi:hypothetical protein
MLSKQGQLEDAAFDRALPVDSRSIDGRKGACTGGRASETCRRNPHATSASIYGETLGMLIDEQIDLEV